MSHETPGRSEGGEREAFAALHDRLAPAVYGLVLHMLGDHTVAESVALDIFLQVWAESAHRQDDGEDPDVWVIRVAHRQASDHLRATRGQQLTAGRDRQSYPAGDEPRHNATGRITRPDMKRLTLAQARTIALAYDHGYTQLQTAQRLGIPPHRAARHLRDALIHLRDQRTSPS